MTTAVLTVLPEHLSRSIRVADTGCWIWEGSTTVDGYGRVYVPQNSDGTGAYQIRAHRAVWEAIVGPCTPGLVIDHLCRVTLCCNTEHMEEVSNVENMRRGEGNGAALYQPRPRPLVCKYGHPYDDANTYVVPSGPNQGTYQCRKCCRMRDRWRRLAPFMPPEYRAIGERLGYGPRGEGGVG